MYACEGTHGACYCQGYPQHGGLNCPTRLLDFVIEHELVRFTIAGDVALIGFVAWSEPAARGQADENICQGLVPTPKWGADSEVHPKLRVLRTDEAGFVEYQAMFTDMTYRTRGGWILIVECAQAEIASPTPLIVFQYATSSQLLDNLPGTEIPALGPDSAGARK